MLRKTDIQVIMATKMSAEALGTVILLPVGCGSAFLMAPRVAGAILCADPADHRFRQGRLQPCPERFWCGLSGGIFAGFGNAVRSRDALPFSSP
jgi:hypothetical protein